MIRTVRGGKLALNVIRPQAWGFGALLAVPLLPPGFGAHYHVQPAMVPADQNAGHDCGVTTLLCLLVLWLQRATRAHRNMVSAASIAIDFLCGLTDNKRCP